MSDNIFHRIITFFAHNDFNETGNQAFWHWIAKDDSAAAKDEALYNIWNEAQQRQNIAETRKAFRLFQKNQGIISRRTVHLWQMAAASLAILLATSLMVNMLQGKRETDYIQAYIPTAEIERITLPDGTKVQLNSHSTLFYPKEFTGKNRSVYLIGEASFQVTPDKKHPFIVKAADFQVTALGTEFNVSAYPDSPTVAATLISGSVLVECNDLGDNAILQPNHQFTYNKLDKTNNITVPDIGDVTAWQRGELVFRGMTIQDILTVLERKYPYSFEYKLKDLKKDEYSFRFKDKASFEEVIDVITNVAGNLSYEIKDGRCILKAR